MSFNSKYKSSEIEAILDSVGGKQDAIADLDTIRSGAAKGATAVQPLELAEVATTGDYNDLSNKPTIPSAVTESTVSGWGFTKNTGTYSKPSGGIPKSDLASAVQTSLGKADTALQSYTEQYKGTVTGVKVNGTTKNPSNGVVDIGTVITAHQDISGKQDKLVSGTNIKTINGESLVGSGNIEISGGSSSGDKIVTLNENVNPTIADIEPEKIYIVGMLLQTLTIESFADNGSKHQQYDIVFRFGPYSTPSLTLPDNVLWANGVIPEINAETPYELSITCSKHGLSWGTVVYKAVLTPFKSV